MDEFQSLVDKLQDYSITAQSRRQAARKLGSTRDPRAVEALIAALSDRDAGVRGDVAWALGRIKDPRAEKPLINALGDEDDDVHDSAARAIIELWRPRSVEPPAAALDDEDGVRAYATILGERLKNAQSRTVLYVDYYYFVLEIDEHLEFYFNANHFIEKVPRKTIKDNVIDWLENNCPKFVNFYRNGQYDENSTASWRPNTTYPQNIPEIGNAYSAMVYKIVTEKHGNSRVIHTHETWTADAVARFETIGEKEVQAFLTLTIFSETHKSIKSIYELDCFKLS